MYQVLWINLQTKSFCLQVESVHLQVEPINLQVFPVTLTIPCATHPLLPVFGDPCRLEVQFCRVHLQVFAAVCIAGPSNVQVYGRNVQQVARFVQAAPSIVQL